MTPQVLRRVGAVLSGDPVRTQPDRAAMDAARRKGRWLPPLSHFAFEYLLALPAGAVIALVWANTLSESYFRFAHAIAFLVNDIAMVAFFALITKEIVESTASGGVLHPMRRLVVPAIAAIGASVAPPLIYLGFIGALDAPMFAQGWPVTLATDLAFGYFMMRVIFGRHPAVPFFLLLAIVANGVGFLALAVADRSGGVAPGRFALLMTGALVMVTALRRAKVRSVWPYLLAGGSLSWSALYWGGFHPALALVPIVPFLPHAARDRGFFVDAPPNARDALSRLELWCRHPAQVALFFFGLVNAGVIVHGLEAATWAVPLATLLGKPLGVLAAVAVAVAAGMHLPIRLGWRDILVIGIVTGIGFTMALFFATSAMAPGQMLSETKMGALVSVGGAAMAYTAARFLRVGRLAG